MKYFITQKDLWTQLVTSLDIYASASKIKSMDDAQLNEYLISTITANNTLKHIVVIMRGLGNTSDVS